MPRKSAPAGRGPLSPARAADAGSPDERAAGLFARLPALAYADGELARRGAFLDARFEVGIGSIPFEVVVAAGRIAGLARGPFLLRPWRFAIRAPAVAWLRLWQPIPEPGWHDILALYKRGIASIEGDLHPLMTNLQFVKDLLVLPRRLNGGEAR